MQCASTHAPGHCDMASVAIYLRAYKDNKSSRKGVNGGADGGVKNKLFHIPEEVEYLWIYPTFSVQTVFPFGRSISLLLQCLLKTL